MKNKLSNNLVISYMGIFLIIIGIINLIPLIVLIFYPEEFTYGKYFFIPASFSIITGINIGTFIPINKDKKLSAGEDSIIVVLTWILAILISAMPFYLSGMLNFTQSVFEAVSGWTTTGLSVVDVDNCPKIYLLHRSIMNFFGGVGIVLVMVSALSATFGMSLYNCEGHSDSLLPNLLKSSRLILSIYTGYVLSGIVLYYIFGMPLFDAINHSIAALSTGGFGVKSESIGAYNSFSIELITIILMLLGTTNFAAHLLLIKGKFKKFFQLGEIKFMFFILGVSIPLVGFFSLNHLYGNVYIGLRRSLFELISALTTTGFSTVTYNDWNGFAIFTMIILMIIGGGAGSTAGGIKLYRVYIMCKNCIWNIKIQFMSPHLVNEDYVYKPEGKVYIKDSDRKNIANYAFIYMVLYVIGVSIMLINNYSLQDSLFEFASALGTVGLSVGITSPLAPPIILWTEILGMLFGRLEIWVIIIAIIKVFDKKERKIV